jgi:hypothetical protein
LPDWWDLQSLIEAGEPPKVKMYCIGPFNDCIGTKRICSSLTIC